MFKLHDFSTAYYKETIILFIHPIYIIQKRCFNRGTLKSISISQLVKIKRVCYLSCIVRKGIWKTFTVLYCKKWHDICWSIICRIFLTFGFHNSKAIVLQRFFFLVCLYVFIIQSHIIVFKDSATNSSKDKLSLNLFYKTIILLSVV